MSNVIEAPAMNAGTASAQPYVRDDVRGVLMMLAASEQPDMWDMPIADARMAYTAMGMLAEAEPAPLAIVRDLVCPGPAGDIPLRYYDARESRSAGPVILFFHGGGFVIGDLESHHSWCTDIASKMDLPLIAVDYRLAPEHPFPAAPDDCEAATRWVADNGKELGLDITGIITTGDSAGGNLTLVVGQALTASPASVPLIMQAPIYPAVDGLAGEGSFSDFAEGYLLTRDAMHWFDKCYAAPNGNPRRDCIHGDIPASPPTLLATAGLDPLRDQGRAYAAKLVEAGVNTVYLEFAGSIHGFTCLRKAIPSAQTDCDTIYGHWKLLLAGLGHAPEQ
ncbi:MAG: alpha/beta hydrolase [Blastomonas sp.]